MKRWKEFRFEYLRTAAVFLLLCAMACTLIWALPAQVHADYTEPVSYTHLDVYKRQEWEW